MGKVEILKYKAGHPIMAVHLIADQFIAIISKNGHHGSLQTVLEKRYVEHPAQQDWSVLLHQEEPAELKKWADEEGSQNGAQLEAQGSSHRQSNALRDQSRNEDNQEEHAEPPPFQGLLGQQIGGHYEQGTADDLDGQVGQGDGHVVRSQGVPTIEVLPGNNRELASTDGCKSGLQAIQ